MISPETVVAFALRNPLVMDQLGDALRSDLVLANPFLRRLAEFADQFLLERRKLPGEGDWEVWLGTLDAGPIRDGTKEALGRLWSIDTSSYDADFFAANVIADLKQAATLVARARLNELPSINAETLLALADKVSHVGAGGLQGLARLRDIELWASTPREDARTPSGFPTLDRIMGGWGEELAMIFADSGVGKSLWLQNAAVNAAIRGKNVLHITLELGIRPQIHRYYRQIAQAHRSEFHDDLDTVKHRLRHWFKFAKGNVYLLEFPAYSIDTDGLRRMIERAARALGDIDVLVLDYLDLMSPTSKSSKGGSYEDLGKLTHETRSLCGAFNMRVLTASQAVRRPQNSGRLTMKDMGDSYQKVRGADILLSLVQTPEEEEVHQGRLGLLKLRDSGGRGEEIQLYINRDLALIQELTHPNTVALMQRLGHLPIKTVPAPGQQPKLLR